MNSHRTEATVAKKQNWRSGCKSAAGLICELARTIRNIYTSQKGKLRAKIERLKQAKFVDVDCDRLIEQQFIPARSPTAFWAAGKIPAIQSPKGATFATSGFANNNRQRRQTGLLQN